MADLENLAAVAVVALLVAVPLVGAMLPHQVPEVVTARAFQVLDEAGTVRARLSLGIVSDEPTLKLNRPGGGVTFYTGSELVFSDYDYDVIDYNPFRDHRNRLTLEADGLRVYLETAGTPGCPRACETRLGSISVNLTDLALGRRLRPVLATTRFVEAHGRGAG